jgi:quinol monooxygenase YgiN
MFVPPPGTTGTSDTTWREPVVITERLTFRAKYGHGDELVALFKEFYRTQTAGSGITGARIYTDVTGPMFSVVVESDFADLAALAAYEASSAQMYGTAEFQGWFGRMMQVTEAGERQLLNCEVLA